MTQYRAILTLDTDDDALIEITTKDDHIHRLSFLNISIEGAEDSIRSQVISILSKIKVIPVLNKKSNADYFSSIIREAIQNNDDYEFNIGGNMSISLRYDAACILKSSDIISINY